MPAIEVGRPNIRIFQSPDAPENMVTQLQLGMEEEGIPWQLEVHEHPSAVALGWKAAQISRLDVGVGVSKAGAVVHFAKLLESQPLFEVAFPQRMQDVRILGTNAARLVKKLPLK